MAHTVTGIDLGAYAVKFVVIEAGFRKAGVVSAFEEPVAPGDTPLADRQAEALTAGIARLSGETTFFVAMPGDRVAIRVLDLPFSDARKIDQVVGYELEGQIVHGLQDVVFDHAILKSAAPDPAGGAASKVLAVAARTDEVTDLLAWLGAHGVEPRSLFVAPAVYHAVLDPESAGLRLLLDIGHRRTNLAFVAALPAAHGARGGRGETVIARTITRGGEAVTAAIAQAVGCDRANAERIKRERGFVASARRPAENSLAERMSAVVREALAPIVRDVLQSLAAARVSDRRPIDGIWLTGGGAEIGGLPEYLAEALGLPVARFAPDLGAAGAVDGGGMGDLVEGGGRVETGDGEGERARRFSLAAAAAWAGARGGREIDLRRGPLQYRASFSVLRQKALRLGVLAAALIASATIDGVISMGRLSRQRDELQARLKAATTELFGEPRMDAQAVTSLLKKGFRDEMAPLPKATAFDLLNEISRKVPAADKIALDVLELDVRPKKTFIKGTADTAAAVDDMVARLKEIDCFEDIAKGSITEASGGAKNFQLTIAAKCP